MQKGETIPLSVKVGDRVMLPQWGENKIVMDDKVAILFYFHKTKRERHKRGAHINGGGVKCKKPHKWARGNFTESQKWLSKQSSATKEGKWDILIT